MLLGVIILIAAGIYVVVKGKIQASSSHVIQGRPAMHIGVAFILGGLLAAFLPFLLRSLGLIGDFVSGFVVSIIMMFASLVYVGIVIVRDRGRQAGSESSVDDKSKS